jgi:hypothetical protein
MQPLRQRMATTAQTDTSSRLFGRDVLVPFFVSRLLSDGLIAAMAVGAGRRVVRGGFGLWDGGWYVAIAKHGYWASWMGVHNHRQTPWPFFPMLPVAMRVGSISGVSPVLIGILVNHLALLLGLAALYRIARRHGSPRSARLATWAAALSPFVFVFSMIYPSAIFFAASVWAFLLVEEDHDLGAGAAAAVAALTRPDGFLVIVVLAFVVRKTPARMRRIAGPGVAALALWILYNRIRTGDALKFFHAKMAWHEVDLLTFVQRGAPRNVTIHLVLAAAAVAVIVVARRRLPTSWIVYTILYLAPSFALGMVGLGRYANDTFPPFVGAGDLLERRRTRTIAVVFAPLVVTQVALAYWFIAERRHVV